MTRLTLGDVAEQILREHSKGAPMHYRRITELAITEALITPGGVTPEASMNAAIGQEIKRREAAGRDPRFKAFGRGRYGLATPVDPLGGAIDRKNTEVRERLHAVLAEMDPRQFEHLIGELLTALGYEDVEVTRYSADGGIDVRGTLSVGGVTEVRTAIQVKRWAKSVSGRTVRELRGGFGPHERGLIITLSDFTKDARREAAELDRSPISLINGEQLVDLLVENEIGVTPRRLTVLELDESAFAPADEEEPPQDQNLGSEPIAEVQRPPRPTFDKALSVWPLPGGNEAWKSTLDRMLAFVVNEAPTMREAIAWMIKSFERVASEKVVRGYWQVLRSFGLIETQGEQVVVTALGAEYLEDPTAERLLEIISDNVVGVDELIDRLRQGPASQDELLAHLNDSLRVGWDTDAQIRFRLGWLMILGVVELDRDVWVLAERPRPSELTPDQLP